MRQSILIISVFLSLLSGAQDLNGIWKGRLVQNPGGCFPVYNIEMHIQLAATRITGVSYHYSDTSNYVKEDFEGTYDSIKNEILIKEFKVVTFHVPENCVPCIKNYSLSFHKGGNEEQLRGSWGGIIMEKKDACPPGTLVLTRTINPEFIPEAKLPPTLTQRKNELVKEIKVDTGTIRLDFYDNGIIDGDTISVYVNNHPVVTDKMLTAKPITTYVKIDLNRKVQEVIMVGENLGSIPPNTALMIVTAGDKRYQLYLVSDEQKNALVRFIYEKPKSP
ncbi:MAG: hypothetical protein JST17_09865 [Bacteroidetes bacterium]|nr:hypothetical protein [Bacteroidota bacterium]MBS1930013.1 hypothetical protein [Bacteroidota bacterium]